MCGHCCCHGDRRQEEGHTLNSLVPASQSVVPDHLYWRPGLVRQAACQPLTSPEGSEPQGVPWPLLMQLLTSTALKLMTQVPGPLFTGPSWPGKGNVQSQGSPPARGVSLDWGPPAPLSGKPPFSPPSLVPRGPILSLCVPFSLSHFN